MLLTINATFPNGLSAINYYEYTLRLLQPRSYDIATLMSNDSRLTDTFASHVCTYIIDSITQEKKKIERPYI